ncbi:MAG: hypothetical protein ACR2FH_10340 [Caulobacteraceae bacterium]
MPFPTNINHWFLAAFGLAFAIELLTSIRWGGRASIVVYVSGFLSILALWFLLAAWAFIEAGPASDDFNSVVGEGMFGAMTLCTIWLPIGLTGLIGGLAVRTAGLWIRTRMR